MIRNFYKIITLIIFLCICTFTYKEVQASSTETFSKTINVTTKKYGAKNGKDSTNAIQKALDDAGKLANSRKRVKVYIPNGTYYINETLRISSNTYLACDKNAKILKRSNNCLFMLRGKYKTRKGGTNDLVNVTIKGGTWDARFMNKNNESGGSVFYFTHTKNLEILNLTLKNCYGSHLIEIGAVDKVRISGCDLFGYKAPSGWGKKEAIQLDLPHNSRIEPDSAPYDDTPCSNVIIDNNKIHDFSRGIGTHSGVKGIYHNKITISNNKIYNIESEAIYESNYTNFEILRNSMTNVGSGITLRGFNSRAETMYLNPRPGAKTVRLNNNNYRIGIHENTITTKKSLSSDAREFGICIIGNSDFPINGVTIKNNRINSASSSIKLRYLGKSEIAFNTINRLNNTKNASAIDAIGMSNSSNNIINANTIVNSRSNFFDYIIAIRGLSKRNEIYYMNLPKAKINGIHIIDKSSATISSTTVSDATKNGIAVMNGSSTTINNTVVNNSGNSGVFVHTDSTVKIENNSYVSRNKDNGIAIANRSNSTIENSIIENNNGYGIFIYNKSNTNIRVTKVMNSKKAGIHINNAKGNLDNNIIIGSNTHGVSMVDNAMGYIRSNIIEYNASTGIYVNRSNIKNIRGNNVKNNSNRGIDITNNAMVEEVRDNTLNNPLASIEMRIYGSTVPPNLSNLEKGKIESDIYNNNIY